MCNPEDDPSEMASSLMGPGPWSFYHDLKFPLSCLSLHPTNKHRKSNISVTHTLKIVIRAEKGDDKETDPKTSRKKLFDISLQTPIQILSVRSNLRLGDLDKSFTAILFLVSL
jgi:hypothetical protein